MQLSYHCNAIPAACGARRRANLFFPPGTRGERDERGASAHAYTAHRKGPGGLILSRITALSYSSGVTLDRVHVRLCKHAHSHLLPSVNNDIIIIIPA